MKQFLVALLLAAPAAWATETPRERSNAQNACEDSERWVFSKAIPKESIEEFRAFVSGSHSPIRGFAEALALRKAGLSAESQVFAEYWMARAVFKTGLHHVATNAFHIIASSEPQPHLAGIQLASLQCLSKLKAQSAVDVNALAQLKQLAQTKEEKEYLANYAIQAYLITLNGELVPLTEGTGVKEAFLRGVHAAKTSQHESTIKHITAAFDPTAKDSHRQASLERYRNQAHLLLARAYYSVGRFERSMAELRAISKSSNELAEALSELAWAALMADRFGEAVGAAVSLEAGNLKNTFSPEALMVTAMAMNELCQYPQSLNYIQKFRKTYESTYRWLEAWNANPDSKSAYSNAIAFLRRQDNTTPVRVGSEWLRSPVFLSGQSEINSLLDQRDLLKKLAKQASAEQKQMGLKIRQTAEELLVRVKAERGRQKTYTIGLDAFTAPLRGAILDFRREVVHYRRFRAAASPWMNVMGNFEGKIAGMKSRIIERINADLAARNVRMFATLQEIAENNQLIEVEIYNGASQDIIWQNAHPDYKEKMKDVGVEQRRGIASKVLDWGASVASADGDTEVWEDEIGSFSAHVFDNCSNKERYLAIGGRK